MSLSSILLSGCFVLSDSSDSSWLFHDINLVILVGFYTASLWMCVQSAWISSVNHECRYILVIDRASPRRINPRNQESLCQEIRWLAILQGKLTRWGLASCTDWPHRPRAASTCVFWLFVGCCLVAVWNVFNEKRARIGLACGLSSPRDMKPVASWAAAGRPEGPAVRSRDRDTKRGRADQAKEWGEQGEPTCMVGRRLSPASSSANSCIEGKRESCSWGKGSQEDACLTGCYFDLASKPEFTRRLHHMLWWCVTTCITTCVHIICNDIEHDVHVCASVRSAQWRLRKAPPDSQMLQLVSLLGCSRGFFWGFLSFRESSPLTKKTPMDWART